MAQALKVLIVDDNEEFRGSLADILTLSKYEVETAANGFAALDLVQREEFDLVLMDVKMPGIDGVETCKRMRKLAPRTAVILVTAHAVDDLVKEALREGAFGMVRKPLDIDLMLELIDRAISSDNLVLVADDDPETCRQVRDALERTGCHVSIANDSRTAAEKLMRCNFDVVLLDLDQPPGNTYQTYLTIRDIRPQVMAIVVNGHLPEMKTLVRKATEQGECTYMEKPVDIDRLIEVIKDLLKRSGY